MIKDHFDRLSAELNDTYSLANIPDWITAKTKIKGSAYSFYGHEFQLQVLLDPSREKVIRKCSQIGLTELSLREALALIRILKGTTFIYTMPTADAVEKICKTRVKTIIEDSADLQFSLSKEVNSTQIKQFDDSFAYFTGTYGQNQAISTPADIIINDEVDFSDPTVLTTFESRDTHSIHKIKRKFSTPTLPGRGISAHFDRSRRHFNFVRCCDCSEWFYPDYYQHVKVPGWDHDLKDLTKHNIHLTRWREAALHCPHCGTQPELGPEFREWVCENPNEKHEAAGYAISPFDAPQIITTPFLVEKSTKYARVADFVNFNLGLPYEDAKENLTRALLESLFMQGEVPKGYQSYCMGIDMGLTCHFMVGKLDHSGEFVVVKALRCALADFERTVAKLKAEYLIVMTVMDALPYTDLVIRQQAHDQNLLGAIYHDSKNLAVFSIVDHDPEAEKGKLPIRQAKVNRDLAFDELLGLLLGKQAVFLGMSEEEKQIVIEHALDMKRVMVPDKNGEMSYTWVKSDLGSDHYFHAMLYLLTAAKLRGMAKGQIPFSSPVRSFRLKNV